MATSTQALHRTPFHRLHLRYGARMVEYAGWEMPMLYESILEEHRQVRRSGGVFDVSHMGRVRFSGADARRFLDRICTRRILGAADGQCRYTLLCNEQGGCHDDGLVYRLGEDEYVLVCNAANREKLLRHFEAQRGDLDFRMRDVTFETGMLAVQGPAVIDLVAQFAPEIASLRRYRFARREVAGAEVLVSRTGYTGEDGVEVILPAELAEQAVALLLGDLSADEVPVKPAGLGARDTLRLEAGMPLYGHEITEEIDPLSAGLRFAVALDKGDDDPDAGRFIGQDALRRIDEAGPARRLRGLVLEGRRTARQGMNVTAGGDVVGFVTSACLSPTRQAPIAMAYLDAGRDEAGRTVEVALGSTNVTAEVIDLPFYKRSQG